MRFVFVLRYLYRHGERVSNRLKTPVFRQKSIKTTKRWFAICKYVCKYSKNHQKKPKKGGTHTMQKNIKQIMIALDQVLNTTVWVNQDRQIISLSDELHIGHNNAPRSIEDLPRSSLVGAYVSLQIRTDNFDVAAETLETHDLALKVKEMVFAEAKKIMDNDTEGAEKHIKAA